MAKMRITDKSGCKELIKLEHFQDRGEYAYEAQQSEIKWCTLYNIEKGYFLYEYETSQPINLDIMTISKVSEYVVPTVLVLLVVVVFFRMTKK